METKTLILWKSPDDSLSSCRCEHAIAGHPSQLSCPWCGCGWLFECVVCGKSFSLAEAGPTRLPLEELAPIYLRPWWGEYTSPELEAEDVREWVAAVKRLCSNLEEGRRYVYLDGFALPLDARDVDLVGWHTDHRLEQLPHLDVFRNPEAAEHTLGSPSWWLPDLRDRKRRTPRIRSLGPGKPKGTPIWPGGGRSGPRYPTWVDAWKR